MMSLGIISQIIAASTGIASASHSNILTQGAGSRRTGAAELASSAISALVSIMVLAGQHPAQRRHAAVNRDFQRGNAGATMGCRLLQRHLAQLQQLDSAPLPLRQSLDREPQRLRVAIAAIDRIRISLRKGFRQLTDDD